MRRRIVQTGSSLAVTLPAEVVEAFGLKKGQDVDVAVHPFTGAVVIRPGAKLLDDGRVSRRFRALADSILERYDRAFEDLAR